jgi:hypothetical protein
VYTCTNNVRVHFRMHEMHACMYVHACTCTFVLFNFYTNTVQLRRGAAASAARRAAEKVARWESERLLSIFTDSRQVFCVCVCVCV